MKSQQTLERFFASLGAAETRGFESMGAGPDLERRIRAVDVAGKTDEEMDRAMSAVRKLERGESWSPPEADAFEAIVLPAERPVIDIVDDSYGAVEAPFGHLATGDARRHIEAVIPAVGRIGLPDRPRIPYAGTGFVVGDGLLMTNRHVASLFASGLGREGVAFQSGQSADVDFRQELGGSAPRLFEIARIVLVHPYWDMALLEVRGLDIAPLRLLATDPESLQSRDAAVIGYPAFDERNDPELQMRIFRRAFNVKRLQPGRFGTRREIRSFGNVVSAATHDSSTLGGNSGSVVLDVASGEVAALHFAGRHLEANFAVPVRELARDRRVHEAGVDFGDVAPDSTTGWDGRWSIADPSAKEASPAPASPPTGGAAPVAAAPAAPGGALTWTVPLHVTVRLGGDAAVAAPAPSVVDAGVERMMEPFHEEDYSGREGYDERFLGRRVRMPKVLDLDVVSKLDDENHVLPYENFSLVMHKHRRIALLTACNVDGSDAARKPDPNRRYTRRALSGLGRNDHERWFTDPRIPQLHQLPDRFFTRDRTAFDKGHLVRRDAVAWGRDYDHVRRANGDTYHVTNCSPQVKGFNRSNLGGLWGELENLVLDAAEGDGSRCSVFSGPILDPEDPPFSGFDDRGRILVRIPQRFWKMVVARRGGRLETFAFLLDQDLAGVDFGDVEADDVEAFAVDREWRGRMIPVADLEREIGLVRFPGTIHESDQYDAPDGERVRARAEIPRYR